MGANAHPPPPSPCVVTSLSYDPFLALFFFFVLNFFFPDRIADSSELIRLHFFPPPPLLPSSLFDLFVPAILDSERCSNPYKSEPPFAILYPPRNSSTWLSFSIFPGRLPRLQGSPWTPLFGLPVVRYFLAELSLSRVDLARAFPFLTIIS